MKYCIAALLLLAAPAAFAQSERPLQPWHIAGVKTEGTIFVLYLRQWMPEGRRLEISVPISRETLDGLNAIGSGIIPLTQPTSESVAQWVNAELARLGKAMRVTKVTAKDRVKTAAARHGQSIQSFTGGAANTGSLLHLN